ncbi:EscU/YscU/HrcU family type III secretion system export apparatus switch protein [Sutcliffiella horikoshii]|uniref:EscU/YscU/HrcU family type III secretion system export apparatus switch protein n=1 Tax=Sutcliffiella horikoshii TaxID=79883 RepID=UPI00203CF32C|nr:EscU/YscU/HrcU family type III secretion system export apparatus switch protein [Sutcliffiella horikoshii]MCM3616276.1 EscU/YscU/HrcU family type III secretion system export apparatus switch protein [Sutcliffiella horikoshii]
MNKDQQKRKKAVAIKYEQAKTAAPVVKAKGAGIIAENIMEEAKKHQIPVQEDEALLEILMELELNETIPEELYEVVAEVLAFVYNLHEQAEKNVKKST